MPLVTISRQYGSGGSAVAAGVAERLGWQLLDNAIVDAIAQQMGVSADTVRALDERQPPLIARIADALALDAREVLSASAGAAVVSPDERMIETTRRVMEAAVAQGPVVVVGRGAQAVLGQRADATHVFCCAPRDALARRVAARENLGLPRASGVSTRSITSAPQRCDNTMAAPGAHPRTITVCEHGVAGDRGSGGVDSAGGQTLDVRRARRVRRSTAGLTNKLRGQPRCIGLASRFVSNVERRALTSSSAAQAISGTPKAYTPGPPSRRRRWSNRPRPRWPRTRRERRQPPARVQRRRTSRRP